MQDGKIGRRLVFGVVGATAFVTLSGAAAAEEVAPWEASPMGAKPILPTGLVAGDYRVAWVGSVEQGAFEVGLEDASGDACVVDVCLRDDSPLAVRGPARSGRFDFFMPNAGTGDTPTNERHGLAAMALAVAIAPYESAIDAREMLTLRDRLATHGENVKSSAALRR